jgi:hypothetical protein
VCPTARQSQDLACFQAQTEGTQKPRNVYTFAGLIIDALQHSIPPRATNGSAVKHCFIPPQRRYQSKPARSPHATSHRYHFSVRQS